METLVSKVTPFSSTKVNTMGSKNDFSAYTKSINSSARNSLTRRTTANSLRALNSKTIPYSTIKPKATRHASTLIINMNSYDKAATFVKSTEPNPSNDSIVLSDGSDIKSILGSDNEIDEKITPEQVRSFILLIDLYRMIFDANTSMPLYFSVLILSISRFQAQQYGTM